MRIVQTAFGVFHSFDLARELEARHHLECIFSTWPRARLAREGVPYARVRTFPWIHTPEYLLRRFGLLPRWLDDQMGYLNALLFDEYTLRTLPPCDALIALSGSALKTGKLVQSRGGLFLCDRGSSHQRFQQQILTEEFKRWGVDLTVSDPRDTRREDAIYDQADAIVVPSSFAARSFLEMGVPSAKVHQIPMGVDLDAFFPVSTPPASRFEVLFVGSVDLRKGIPYLLQAFATLKYASKRLRMVGALGRDIRSVLPRLPMQDVEFVGSVPHSQLPAIMGSSHVLVLPSIEDGFGLVIGQAMACGCPVITSVNTGGPDMITDGIEGFLIPIRDPRTLGDRLQQLAGDPTLQSRMRAAGLKRVQQLGGWKSYGDAWEHLLVRLTGVEPNAGS